MNSATSFAHPQTNAKETVAEKNLQQSYSNLLNPINLINHGSDNFLALKKASMQFETFLQSISSSAAPANSSVYLRAMWHDAKNEWEKAHGLVDSLHDATACWVHAYLHRKEGDIGNADYWYRRAGKTRPSVSLQEEWEMIVRALL